MSSAPLRRFQCTNWTCTKSFTRNEALQAHISGKHLGSKPFKCSMCDVRFVRTGDRNKHEKNVHELIRSFCCEAEGCKKAYATKFQLNRHFDKLPGHAHVESLPQPVEGTGDLMDRLAEEVEWAVDYCENYAVSVNLDSLYADIANHFRRFHEQPPEFTIRALNLMVDERMAQGLREHDQQMSELKAMYHHEWRAFERLRRIIHRLGQVDLEATERRIPTPEVGHDLPRLHERTERERRCEEDSQMHRADDERPTSTEEEDRLAAAADEKISFLLQGQLQRVSPGISLEWIKDSLHAAFSAHQFCKSVHSGHTNSTMESVRIHSLAGSVRPESRGKASSRYYCRDSKCESEGFSEYECYKIHMRKCHPSFVIEHLDVKESLRELLPEYTGNAEYGAGRHTRDAFQDQSLMSDEMNCIREWEIKAMREELASRVSRAKAMRRPGGTIVPA